MRWGGMRVRSAATAAAGRSAPEADGGGAYASAPQVEFISEDECVFLYDEIFVRQEYMQHGACRDRKRRLAACCRAPLRSQSCARMLQESRSRREAETFLTSAQILASLPSIATEVLACVRVREMRAPPHARTHPRTHAPTYQLPHASHVPTDPRIATCSPQPAGHRGWRRRGCECLHTRSRPQGGGGRMSNFCFRARSTNFSCVVPVSDGSGGQR